MICQDVCMCFARFTGESHTANGWTPCTVVVLLQTCRVMYSRLQVHSCMGFPEERTNGGCSNQAAEGPYS